MTRGCTYPAVQFLGSTSLRVGLTLPACTLPLLMVVGALAVTLDSVVAAIVAGVIFATAFTALLVYASIQGMGNDERQFLDRAARGSPYLTAALLFGATLALLLSQVDFSAERLATALEKLDFLSRYQHALEIVGGLILIGTGLYMLNAYLLVV